MDRDRRPAPRSDRRGVLMVVAVAVFMFAGQLSTVQGQPADENGKSTNESRSIAVSDLTDARVFGLLGKPLGTLVQVEGRYKDMTFTRAKADEGRVVLLIDRVDGRSLPNVVRFDFARGRLFDRIKPKDGETFQLLGYESGGFWGDVEGAAQFEVVVAKPAIRFGYHSRFVVLKDNKLGVTQRGSFQ